MFKEMTQKEMMMLDGGKRRSSTRHERSGGYSRVTDEARQSHINVVVGAAVSAVLGGAGGAAFGGSVGSGVLGGGVSGSIGSGIADTIVNKLN
ncbi:hypothetical protein Amet_1034 [Alkaliphilus metalliredigens QYMF]|uniref:Uncharacterized protein n=1 Tax=Alkaliphilus metalliredigens (strain QYMF) TaxID=293826 RepID=A6TM33_ALKMQ|nr:hypothetical protein [Alkaliphilus metalliredigens]ABR47251.1 hypothetical protein Amet_1034 [Alkaliphilus metalliredigens QYMF]